MKQVFKSGLLVAIVGAASMFVAGCDAGSAPPGMSDGDAKAAIDKMSPEDKIRAIASSPMAAVDKEKKYAEIEAASGVKAADVLKGGAPATGAGGPSN
jgi:hypothetical protein